jgi:hypothetical protein
MAGQEGGHCQEIDEKRCRQKGDNGMAVPYCNHPRIIIIFLSMVAQLLYQPSHCACDSYFLLLRRMGCVQYKAENKDTSKYELRHPLTPFEPAEAARHI